VSLVEVIGMTVGTIVCFVLGIVTVKAVW